MATPRKTRCLRTNPGLLIAIAGDGLDQFVETVVEAVSLHKPGPLLTTGIHEACDKGVERFSSHLGGQTIAGERQLSKQRHP